MAGFTNYKLPGIKGYAEDIADNATIISRYYELYRIEQAFRISKNDWETRSIFDFKEEPVKPQMPICFIAQVLSKCIENFIQVAPSGTSLINAKSN
ncbi:MAG: hypothetical protein BGN92_01015 [Sphingobacteriales bacterium 41-5]|nr:MAG: hypothetical protein BGN92_01015 [Sphingobacteriales bacterium 41-5]